MSASTNDSGPDTEAGNRDTHPIISVLHTASLRRVLLAFFIFNTMEWATWIAILVWVSTLAVLARRAL